MRTAHFHEDDYCQVELLPLENLEWCTTEIGRIRAFADAHRAGVGWTDVFVRSEPPASLQSRRIPVEAFVDAIRRILPEYDRVTTGYGSVAVVVPAIRAFGDDRGVIVFVQSMDEHLSAVWLDVTPPDVNALLALASWPFLLVDWNGGVAVPLNSASSIRDYVHRQERTLTMRNESPQTLEQIIDAFEREEAASTAYWNAFDTGAFFRRIGEAWSPAENVRHLSKSTRPVVKALTVPKIILRLRFGKPKRSSLDYDALRARYRDALAEGGKAGRFAPSERSAEDLEVFRAEIMNDFARVHGELRKALARWPDPKLDALQLPHPLLGPLTIREMLFFTLYHQRHHMAVVERRLGELAGANVLS